MPQTQFSPAKLNHPRATVTELVQHLTTEIMQAGLQAGDKLPPERQLCELIGVSRSQLREALKCLDMMGFLDIRQGDGTYLAESANSILPRTVSWGMLLGSREAAELIEARYFIEKALVSLAATRITAAEIDKLDELLLKMQVAKTPKAFSEVDSQFHLTIAAAAQNPVLYSVLTSIKSLLAEWIAQVISHEEDTGIIIQQHKDIRDALAANNPHTADEAMSTHIREVTERLRRSLEDNNH